MYYLDQLNQSIAMHAKKSTWTFENVSLLSCIVCNQMECIGDGIQRVWNFVIVTYSMQKGAQYLMNIVWAENPRIWQRF